jgi:hypothetical protein
MAAPGGAVELEPGGWAEAALAREVDTFVRRFKSVPAFTANLTMDLFQRQTQG